jgi:hypothetical protein
MDARIFLFFMSTFAGLVMIVGGMWLIYKEKIYIDKESKQPIEVKLPGNFSFKSNYPALALFALGFFPLVYPFHELPLLTEYVHVNNVKVKGLVHADAFPALVYAARVPYPAIKTGEEFSLAVPFVNAGEEYKILLIVNGHVLDSQTAVAAEGREINIKFRDLIVEPPAYKGTVAPIPADYTK